MARNDKSRIGNVKPLVEEATNACGAGESPVTRRAPQAICCFPRSFQVDPIMVNIVTCASCGSTQARKPRPCIKCGAELPALAIEGKLVKPTVKESLQVDQKNEWKNKNAKIVREIEVPDGKDNFITSTFKGKESS